MQTRRNVQSTVRNFKSDSEDYDNDGVEHGGREYDN
jgi:hypothetical protein